MIGSPSTLYYTMKEFNLFLYNFIHVYQIQNARALLFLAGEGDLDVPSALHAREAAKILDAHGHKNYEIACYPGAGHLIEPPYSPFCRNQLWRRSFFGSYSIAYCRLQTTDYKSLRGVGGGDSNMSMLLSYRIEVSTFGNHILVKHVMFQPTTLLPFTILSSIKPWR